MMLQILKAKIQGVIVSESHTDYPGSISLPDELMRASGIRPFEMVHVNNKTNGNRIITYAVGGKIKGRVTINGAASRLFQKGDIVHILAFAFFNESETDSFRPTLIITDRENNLLESKPYVIG
jgi:aspartate 1-decarboxylase